ncbi:MAG: NUMOD3 domain-containing DNA-binding protein [Candidatus Nanohalobium sp.]
MEDTECPTCGKEDFSNESYMKRHHKLAHDESLREKYECSLDGCDNKSCNPKFCSEECLGKARRKYEKSECKNSNCNAQVYKFEYCSRECANKSTWNDRTNPAKRPEIQDKIADSQKGDKNNMRRKGGHSEESKQKISNSMSGEDHPLYGVKGKDHPSYGNVSGLKLQKVEKTGHRVRSDWEREIDEKLHESDLNFEYEPKTFELSSSETYTPDFIVEDEIVIEVKGWADERSKKRAKQFMEKFSDYYYLVIGNELPNDKFISWSERNSLISFLREIRN